MEILFFVISFLSMTYKMRKIDFICVSLVILEKFLIMLHREGRVEHKKTKVITNSCKI